MAPPARDQAGSPQKPELKSDRGMSGSGLRPCDWATNVRNYSCRTHAGLQKEVG